MSGRAVSEKAVEAVVAAGWLDGNRDWAHALLADALPYLEAEWKERLLERHYAAGGERARHHRLGIRIDEDGFEHRGGNDDLPDGLCSADMMAAYGCVRAALDATQPHSGQSGDQGR